MKPALPASKNCLQLPTPRSSMLITIDGSPGKASFQQTLQIGNFPVWSISDAGGRVGACGIGSGSFSPQHISLDWIISQLHCALLLSRRKTSYIFLAHVVRYRSAKKCGRFKPSTPDSQSMQFASTVRKHASVRRIVFCLIFQVGVAKDGFGRRRSALLARACE